jgi:multidrug efflux pump subunit AcrA (membrane-fusion protein)
MTELCSARFNLVPVGIIASSPAFGGGGPLIHTLTFATTALKRATSATIGATGTTRSKSWTWARKSPDASPRWVGQGRKNVDYGSVVAGGALLAKIDDSVYAADLSVAAREPAPARVSNNERELERGGMETRALFAAG